MAKTTAKAKSSRTTNAKKPASSTVYICPNTKQNVYVARATLADLKAKSTYANTSKRLWTIPSSSVRTDLLSQSAQALAQVEQSLLPSYGGRSWEVTCQLSDASSTLFRSWKGRMELAVLPHLMEKIPPAPCKLDEYEDSLEGGEQVASLQDRDVSSLSLVAWELRHKHAVPDIKIKWQSPERKIFHSRKQAWEHAKGLYKRELELNKQLKGVGASGKLLQPFIPSAKAALQIGKMRFERDGLWVIGQELQWQEMQPEALEEEKRLIDEKRLQAEPMSGLDLFLIEHRLKYKEDRQLETIVEAESELRKVWKTLPRPEKQQWNIRFKGEPPKKEEKEVKRKTKSQKKKNEKPEPIKLSINPMNYYVNERREAWIEERRVKRPGWGDLPTSETNLHIKQEWKELPKEERKKWTDKLIALETERQEKERQIKEAEEAAAREKEEIELKAREAKEALEKEKADKELLERKLKETVLLEPGAPTPEETKEIPEQTSTAFSKNLELPVELADNGIAANQVLSRMQHEEEKKDDENPSRLISSDLNPLVAISANESSKKTKSRPSSMKKQRIPTHSARTRWCMSKEQIDKCYKACIEHHDTVMRTVKARDLHRELQDGFDVFRERGHGRYDMELPVFDEKEFEFLTDLTKAPWMPVVKTILGEDPLVIHKGCFLSVPGSAIQVYHQDGVHLTTQTQRPCHAINVFIPLVDLTTRNGPTEFTLGSHILGLDDYDRDFVETPTPKAGTPVIFDYRLGHRGLGNSSQAIRPVVYVTYARASDGKEFRDSVNFSRKRYHKIGELKSKVLTREERKSRRKRSIQDREDIEIKRVLKESDSIVPIPIEAESKSEEQKLIFEKNKNDDDAKRFKMDGEIVSQTQ